MALDEFAAKSVPSYQPSIEDTRKRFNLFQHNS